MPECRHCLSCYKRVIIAVSFTTHLKLTRVTTGHGHRVTDTNRWVTVGMVMLLKFTALEMVELVHSYFQNNL